MPVGKMLSSTVKLDVMLRVDHAYKLVRSSTAIVCKFDMEKRGLSLFFDANKVHSEYGRRGSFVARFDLES